MQDFFFPVHSYYMDEKENATVKELIHLADSVRLQVLLYQLMGVLFIG